MKAKLVLALAVVSLWGLAAGPAQARCGTAPFTGLDPIRYPALVARPNSSRRIDLTRG